jgi:hypothetical protein
MDSIAEADGIHSQIFAWAGLRLFLLAFAAVAFSRGMQPFSKIRTINGCVVGAKVIAWRCEHEYDRK